jgi:hypothetical protein
MSDSDIIPPNGPGEGTELIASGSVPLPVISPSRANPSRLGFWFGFTEAVDSFWQSATNDMSVLSTFVFVMVTALVAAGHYQFATTFATDYSGRQIVPLRHDLDMPFDFFGMAGLVLCIYTLGYMWFVKDRTARLRALTDGQRMPACTRIFGSEKGFDGGLVSCRAVLLWTTFLICFSFVACGIEALSFGWCPGEGDAAVKCFCMLPVSAVVFAVLYGLYAAHTPGDIRPAGYQRSGSGRFLLTLIMVVSFPLAIYYVLLSAALPGGGVLRSMIHVCIGFAVCFATRLLFKEAVTVDEDRGFKAD